MFYLLAFLLAISPQTSPIYEVDMVELNEVYDPTSGEKVMEQVILWEWSDDYETFIVIDYIAAYNRDQKQSKQNINGIVLFKGNFVKGRITKQSKAVMFLNDPEVLNKLIVPQEKRRKLNDR